MRTARLRTTVLAATTAALALTAGATAVSAASAATPAKAGNARAAATQQCDVDDLSYSVLHRFANEQGDHLLVTARNTGSAACWLTSYPSVKLGSTTKALPHSSKDAPGGDARITVRPGEKIYSAVALFAGMGKDQSATQFSLALRDQSNHTGTATKLTSRDAKGNTSKFTWSEADVLNWNKQKPYDF